MNLTDLLQEELYPVVLQEADLGRILTSYMDKGFIIVSAQRSAEAENATTPEQMASLDVRNKKNEQELKSMIRSAGFGFIPTWGGYKEKVLSTNPETGEKTEKLVDTPKPEPSFVVPARALGKDETRTDYEALKTLGIEIASRFNQDSFLWKPPMSVDPGAYYVDKSGNEVMSFGGPVDPNNIAQDYYTQLRKGSERS